MPAFYLSDGKLIPGDESFIGPDSRAFRYGDGLFETIRSTGNDIPLWEQHAARCFKGLTQLNFEIPPFFGPDKLREDIFKLCRKNNLTGQSRIRLVFFRGNGGVFDPVSDQPHYIIQSWELPAHYQSFNTNGIELIVYPEARKSTDAFSNLKSNNFLYYLLAADYARKHQCNEALVLNTHSRIADATTANIFWIRDKKIFTTPLSEGPVAGVMRAWLLKHELPVGLHIRENTLTEEELSNADEIFLTNATAGIRWVGRMGSRKYTHSITRELYNDVVVPLFS